VRGRYYADRVISIDRADVSSCLTGQENFSGPLLETFRKYSLIVNWLGNQEGDLSYHTGSMGNQKIIASRPISQRTTHQHRINIFLESLSSLQIPIPFSLPQVFPSPEDKKMGQEALLSSGIVIQGRPVLAIHPGSGGRYKCWDLTRFIEVSHQVKEHLGFQPLFILGPAERGLAPKLKNSLDRHVPILDSIPLPILAGALTWCGGYLGNDSGVTHLAAALEIPSVAIFGPTDPHLWGPLGQHVKVLSKRMEGRHAGERICQGCGCLDLISVENVIHVLSETALDYSVMI
jgi:ADP-heptose:LPS heptosyltransferase